MSKFWGAVLALGGLAVAPVAAQQAALPAPAASAVPATRILYFDAQGRQMASAEGADHREELVYRDSTGGNVRIYYPSGKLRRQVPYAHFAYGLKHGAECSFYETGEIKSRCEFLLNVPVGSYVAFYRSGAVRLRIPVQATNNGEEAKGEAFLPDGKPSPAGLKLEKMPVLTTGGTGNAAILAQIQSRVRYPAEALRKQLMGKVVVTFMVDDAGFVRNIRIVETPSPIFNSTVLQAVASLGRFTPGESDGETVDVFYTLPVTFRIR